MDNRPDNQPRPGGDAPRDEATDRTGKVTPDPHRGEPLPAPEEGIRPEALAAGVRPEQDEPLGPVAELVSADVTAVEARYTDDPEAVSEAERMGVEGEGIASAQILGLMAATIVVVLIAIVAVFYWTDAVKSDAAALAEGEIEIVPEGREAFSRGAAAMDYGVSADSAYTLPIERAMELVMADYAALQDGAPGIVEPPADRAGFNASASNEGRAIVEGVTPMNASELGAPAVGLNTPRPQPAVVLADSAAFVPAPVDDAPAPEAALEDDTEPEEASVDT